MTTTISGTSGVTFPAGGVGNPAGAVVGTTDTQTLTNKTLTTPNIDSAQIPTVSGTAPLYMCRAWVNFNGTGTVAIRASGNVTSITDNGTGDYTINFTTAMSDANYSATLTMDDQGGSVRGGSAINIKSGVAPTTSAIRISTFFGSTAASDGNVVDALYANVAIFR